MLIFLPKLDKLEKEYINFLLKSKLINPGDENLFFTLNISDIIQTLEGLSGNFRSSESLSFGGRRRSKKTLRQKRVKRRAPKKSSRSRRV
jgi:hypothetical protein